MVIARPCGANRSATVSIIDRACSPSRWASRGRRAGAPGGFARRRPSPRCRGCHLAGDVRRAVQVLLGAVQVAELGAGLGDLAEHHRDAVPAAQLGHQLVRLDRASRGRRRGRRPGSGRTRARAARATSPSGRRSSGTLAAPRRGRSPSARPRRRSRRSSRATSAPARPSRGRDRRTPPRTARARPPGRAGSSPRSRSRRSRRRPGPAGPRCRLSILTWARVRSPRRMNHGRSARLPGIPCPAGWWSATP